MIRCKYLFLTLSLIAFAIGFSEAQDNVFFWLGRPIGAILFGLFMIFMVLEKESLLYDEQKRTPELAKEKSTPRPQTNKTSSQEVAATPALTLAQNH